MIFSEVGKNSPKRFIDKLWKTPRISETSGTPLIRGNEQQAMPLIYYGIRYPPTHVEMASKAWINPNDDIW